MTRSALAIVAAAAAAALPCSATAAEYLLDLSGDVSATTFNSFRLYGQQYNIGQLVLSGLTPIYLEAGDVVHANVTFNGMFTVPASIDQYFLFNLYQSDPLQSGRPIYPGEPTLISGTIDFALSGGGSTGRPNDTANGNCSNCLSVITRNGYYGQSFSFDRLVTTTNMDALGTSQRGA